MNQELYNNIISCKIQDSLYLSTSILLKDIDKNFDILIYTFLSICSYIGSFINICEIRLWLNVLEDIKALIENDNIIIKDIYIIVVKLCILCDIYIKNPITKTGTIPIKILREKVIDIFETDFKITDCGITKFQVIIPSVDNPTYNIAIQIITGYIYIIKNLDNIDDDNKIIHIANKIRKSFDYLIRKKLTFETKFFNSDNDVIWFIFGLISILFNDKEFDLIYEMFMIDYNKKYKNSRIGFIWACGLVIVYVKKKHIARNWNKNELIIIQKIQEHALDIYKTIKQELIEKKEIIETKIKKENLDGIDYIYNMQHNIKETQYNIHVENIVPEVKTIKYK